MLWCLDEAGTSEEGSETAPEVLALVADTEEIESEEVASTFVEASSLDSKCAP